jgi:hypothetical protein
MTPTNAAQIAMRLLEQNTFSISDRKITWTLHDAIVDHAERDGVTRDEAFLIIKAMQKLFPLMLTRDANDSVEFEFFAIDDDRESYVWCSIYIPNDSEKDYCETCIADEVIDNLPHHLSRYL